MKEEIIPSNKIAIQNKIYILRGVQVMLDSDLAILYGVETRVFNQAVKRTIERFPEFLCFQLTEGKSTDLRWKPISALRIHRTRHFNAFCDPAEQNSHQDKHTDHHRFPRGCYLQFAD